MLTLAIFACANETAMVFESTGSSDDTSVEAHQDTAQERDSGEPIDTELDDTGPDTSAPSDRDGDGYASDEDCDDDDASVHRGALEVCDDGKDNDCNGYTDADDETSICDTCTPFYSGDSMYLCCQGLETWSGARDLCAGGGMDLVAVGSSGENQLLEEHYAATCNYGQAGTGGSPWIGLSWNAGAGEWAWVDGTGISAYSAFPEGEEQHTGESCVTYLVDGTWDARDCGLTSQVVCEST